jgi:hypothetical protein
MAHENQSIPEFMTKYYQGSNHHGKEDIAALAKDYETERAKFLQTSFVERQMFQRDWIRLTGKGKPLTVDEELAPMNIDYEAKAKALAEKSGYQEKENEQQQDNQLELPLEQTAAQTNTEAPTTGQEDDRPKMLSQLKKLHAENARMTQRQRP